MKPLIAPSLLAADFAHLAKEVASVTKAGADWLHLDIMDGHFVPNLSFGPDVVRAIRPLTDIPFDVHLMTTYPSDFIEAFALAGADYITVHIESCDDVMDLISQIKKYHKKVGISIKPNTKVADLIPFLPLIDLVLVMSVEPGFGGQAFEQKVIEKIAELKLLIGKKKVLISVDGGINAVTAPACVLAGADVLVAGSAIFKHKPYKKAIQVLRKS